MWTLLISYHVISIGICELSCRSWPSPLLYTYSWLQSFLLWFMICSAMIRNFPLTYMYVMLVFFVLWHCTCSTTFHISSLSIGKKLPILLSGDSNLHLINGLTAPCCGICFHDLLDLSYIILYRTTWRRWVWTQSLALRRSTCSRVMEMCFIFPTRKV